MCDEDEECTGFHYYPMAENHYLYKHGTELVQDKITEDFIVYKKHMMTCEQTGEKTEDSEEAEEDGEEESGEEDEL